MKILMMAAILGFDIDCDSLKTSNHVEKQDAWKYHVCESKFKEYKKVKLKAVRVIKKKIHDPNKLDILDISDPLGGRMKVTRVERIDGEVEEISTIYWVDAYRSTWVSTKKLNLKSHISENSIIQRDVNVGKYIGLRKFIDLSPEGKYVQKSITRGQIIFSEFISDAPLIEADGEVVVILSHGAIRLEMKGIAIQSGYVVDEFIKVRIPETGKILTGQIKANEKIFIEI